MPELLPDPLIGKTFSGRFEIVACIGAGGMGRVYRAIERRLDRVVALKVLRPKLDEFRDPSFEDRFFLEARTTARLRHPNTVTLYDYGRSDEGVYFMALELLEGKTLLQILAQEGPLKWPRALSIGAQVARSLREAHQLGLVHRDLKPSNIMLLPEGPLGDLVKVLDFGLVKPIAPQSAASRGQAPLGFTDERMVLGSPLYMAPEQARKTTDPRSDVYSLGAVLFTVLSGRTPFVDKRPFDLMLKHMHEQPPELRSLVDIPPLVNALVMRCLEKAPEARFQNMDELLMAMHQAVNGLGFGGLFVTQRPGPWELDRTNAPVVRPTRRQFPPRGRRVVVGAVMACVALGAAAATSWRSSPPSQPPVAAPSEVGLTVTIPLPPSTETPASTAAPAGAVTPEGAETPPGPGAPTDALHESASPRNESPPKVLARPPPPRLRVSHSPGKPTTNDSPSNYRDNPYEQ